MNYVEEFQERSPAQLSKKVFPKVRLEESRRKVMMESLISSSAREGSVLVVCGSQQPTDIDNKSKKGHLWCDQSRKSGHIKDNYLKIYGKLADQKLVRF